MNWAPRWLHGYYNESDDLRRLIFSSAIYHLDRAGQFFKDHVRHSFYGPEGSSRSGWVAKYYPVLNYVPEVEIVCDDPYLTTAIVWEADSWGSFLHEEIHPVLFKDPAGALYLKNLESVSFSAVSSSGFLELQPFYDLHPRVQDSPIIVSNGWEDRFIIDPSSVRLRGTKIIGLLNGTYTVSYLSQSLVSEFISGESYLSFQDEQVFVKPLDLENIWDRGAQMFGLNRKDRESNTALKTRFQHYALSHKPETMISATLGEVRVFLWNPQDSWSTAGSGAYQLEVQGIPQYEYFEEYPIKYGQVFLLTQQPSGILQAFYLETPIESHEFTVTGSVFIPQSHRLNTAVEGEIRIRYRKINYLLNMDGSFVSSIMPGWHRPGLYYTLSQRKVRLLSNVKKIKKWRWNHQGNHISGISRFG